jgi:hypothetical protein
LNKQDRKWTDRVAVRDLWLSQEQRLRGSTKTFEVNELDQTIWLLAFLFSTAIGKSLPPLPRITGLRGKQGRSKGNVNDIVFQDFVFQILTYAAADGGDLKIDKNHQKGSLITALEILRPHLPKGAVPNALPFGTLQKIRTKHLKARRIWLEPPAKYPSSALDHK